MIGDRNGDTYTGAVSRSRDSSNRYELGSVSKFKDRLTALSIDLDDKNKLSRLLTRKIETERRAIAEVERDVSKEMAPRLEQEVQSQREDIEAIIRTISELMQDKKSILSHCQDVMETLDQQEKQLESELRSIHAEGEALLEQDRRAFRASHEDRLQQRLQQRLQDHKDKTARALEPELQRLKTSHEREVQELEHNHQHRQGQIQAEAARRLEARLGHAEREVAQERQTILRSLEDDFAEQQRRIETEHLLKVNTLTEEHNRRYAQEKKEVQQKLEQERRDGQQQLIRQQELSRNRIDEIRTRQAKELLDLEKDFEFKCREAKNSLQEAKQKIEASFRREFSSQSQFEDGIPNSSRDFHKHSSSSSSLVLTDSDDNSNPITGKKDLNKGSSNNKSPTKHSKMNISKSEIHSATSVDEALLRDRDQRIQAEIKTIQLETIRLERQWQAQVMTTIKDVEVATRQEEQVISKELRRVSELVTQAILQNQQSIRELPALQAKVVSVTETLESVGKEQTRLEMELDKKTKQYHNMKLMRARHRQDEEEMFRADVEQLRQEVEGVVLELRRQQESLDDQLAAMEKEYDQELERLDGLVKAQMKAKDDQLVSLKEAIQTETVAITRLNKILSKYQGGETSMEVP